MRNQPNNKETQHYERVGELVSIFQRGVVWYAHFRQDGKPQRRSLKTRSKKQARRQALSIERDLITGQLHQPMRAPAIKEVIDKYLTHLQAVGRSQKTIDKYQFCFQLVMNLAAKLKLDRIDQIDLAFIDEFQKERIKHPPHGKKDSSIDESKREDR